jgi:hypothetical protein
MKNYHLLLGILFLGLLACEKTTLPPAPAPVFELYLNNSFSELNARFGVFVSDQNTGAIRAFRWVPSEDSLVLQVPNSQPSDRFDCTVIKITTLDAPGTGVRDTFLNLTTYTDLGSNETINLRNLYFQQTSSLKFNLTGMNTLDSIVVPDAYAISKPQPANNYTGEYFCYHTGKCWIRILVDGDKFWRFVRFDGITGNAIEANTMDANLFLSIFAPPLRLNLPFTTNWDYKVDGIVDTSRLEFFPLSAQLRVPGSFTPIIDGVDVIEPVNNELFEPNRPYNGFRIQTRGTEAIVGGYTYISDRFYSQMPATLPLPDFDLQPTILSDNRLVAVQCIGDFDLLSFSRIRSAYGIHLHINWEVVTQPRSGIVSYRLPDVPVPLGDLYAPLKKYDFNAGVKARAESY